MPNPYAPRTTRAAAASFPEGRMRRIGADDDEVATMRTAWEAMTADEQQQAADAIAALTDEELVADLADQRESTVLEALETWAGEQVAAGTFPDANAALDALDLVALLSDEDRAALAVQEPAAEAPAGADEQQQAADADESPEPSTDAGAVLEAARGRMTQAPSKILRWVGTDQARAAAVLVLERQADKPRVALTSGAEAILSA